MLIRYGFFLYSYKFYNCIYGYLSLFFSGDRRLSIPFLGSILTELRMITTIDDHFCHPIRKMVAILFIRIAI